MKATRFLSKCHSVVKGALGSNQSEGKQPPLLKKGALLLCRFCIEAYQVAVRPFVGSCCRFFPSCSCYTLEALTRHGFRKGFWLSIKRIVRCAPWHPGGYDPVPPSGDE